MSKLYEQKFFLMQYEYEEKIVQKIKIKTHVEYWPVTPFFIMNVCSAFFKWTNSIVSNLFAE